MSEHANLAAALAAFQAELPTLGKGNTAKITGDKGNYSYRYADLADVSKLVLPLLGRHGLSFTARPTMVDGRFVLEYDLLHASGERIGGAYPLPAVGRPQEVGSAITYARRYALGAVTGVAPDEDDDGQAAQAGYEQATAEEQMLTTDAFEAEITSARTVEALTDTAKAIRRSMGGKHITRAQYDRLVQVGAARRAELKQEEQSRESNRDSASRDLAGPVDSSGEGGGAETPSPVDG